MGVWEEMAEFVACNDDDGGACLWWWCQEQALLVPIKPSLPRLGSQRSLHKARVKVHTSFHMLPKPIPYHFIIPQFVT